MHRIYNRPKYDFVDVTMPRNRIYQKMFAPPPVGPIFLHVITDLNFSEVYVRDVIRIAGGCKFFRGAEDPITPRRLAGEPAAKLFCPLTGYPLRPMFFSQTT